MGSEGRGKMGGLVALGRESRREEGGGGVKGEEIGGKK